MNTGYKIAVVNPDRGIFAVGNTREEVVRHLVSQQFLEWWFRGRQLFIKVRLYKEQALTTWAPEWSNKEMMGDAMKEIFKHLERSHGFTVYKRYPW